MHSGCPLNPVWSTAPGLSSPCLICLSNSLSVNSSCSWVNTFLFRVQRSHIFLWWTERTWRWRSGQPRPAKSHDSSGQLYRSSKIVSPTMSSFAYRIPILSSVLEISASVYSSKRFAGSSVKTTRGAGVYNNIELVNHLAKNMSWDCTHPTMCAILVLVKCSHTERANVTSKVIARRN